MKTHHKTSVIDFCIYYSILGTILIILKQYFAGILIEIAHILYRQIICDCDHDGVPSDSQEWL